MKTTYEPLLNILKNFSGDYYKSTIEGIEKIIGSNLPLPAYEKDAWWSNKSYPITREVGKVGWRVSSMNFNTEEVEFEKVNLTAAQKLKSYILNRMKSLVIYQSLIIEILVKMDGTSTKETLMNQIKSYYQNNSNLDYEWFPLYEILKENGIIKQKDDHFSLNGYPDFNNEQKQEIVGLCEQKIKEFQSKNSEEDIQKELNKLKDEDTGNKFINNRDFAKFLDAVEQLSPFHSPTGRPSMTAKQFQTLYRVLYGTALKIEEVLNLKVKNLDLQNRLIFVVNSKESNDDPATILSYDIPYLRQHIVGLKENDLLFNTDRQTVWLYAKMAGRKAGLKIVVKKGEKKIEGAWGYLFRDSRARQMWLDGATDDLINLKLRKNFTNTEFKDEMPTIELLKNWELEKYPSDYSEAHQQNWAFDLEPIINEILKIGTAKELALKRETVMKIIHHLRAGKHVVLEGPPGVGKTDLARSILKILGNKIIDNEKFIESVASDIWSRYEVIGGLDATNQFQIGYVTKAAIEHRWLLIDEFNRADMNKAFSDMFLAVESKVISLRPDEAKIYGKESVKIPDIFRMICTMNDFDKNLLLSELSYGLISRFAFVSIDLDKEKEQNVVRERIKSEDTLNFDTVYYACSKQIESYYKFINDVRIQRNIGVRTSIDVIKYLIITNTDTENDDHRWTSLNDALCDYVLPQFDRLDRITLEAVLKATEDHLKHSSFQQFHDEIKNQVDNLVKAMSLFEQQ